MLLPNRVILTHALAVALVAINGLKLFTFGRTTLRPNFYPELSAVKGHIMLMVTIAIFACDFSFFPAQHLKTKYYGVSLMDVGIGSFLYHNGAFSLRMSRKKVLKSALVNAVLGTIRLATVRSFKYTVDVTEYGRDLNFYFVLAITYLLFLICNSRYNFYTALAMMLVHQALLSNGLDEYVFNSKREHFLAYNKEGILSIVPSLAIFLFGSEVGRMLFAQEDHAKKVVKIFHYGVVFLYGYILSSAHSGMSRRLGNMSYVLWIVLLHTFQVCLSSLVGSCGVRATPLQEFCSRNMLFIFLWSNILVLVANLCYDLKQFGVYGSVAFNLAYLSLVFLVPAYAHRFYHTWRGGRKSSKLV